MNYTDEDLLKFSEKTLSPKRTKQLGQMALHDLELCEAMSAIEASRLQYSAAYAQQNVPPVPDFLKKQVQDWVKVSGEESGSLVQSQSKFQAQSVQKFGVAACILLSFVGGYFASAMLNENKAALITPLQNSTPQSMQLAENPINADFSSADQAWAKRVADYQSLYVPNTVKTNSNALKSAEELLAGITLETGIQTGIPDLSSQGYQFARAQELGFEGDTLVQLVYVKEGKVPLAFCYMAANSTASLSPNLMQISGLGVAHWRESGQRFVIVADETQEVLGRLYSDAQSLQL